MRGLAAFAVLLVAQEPGFRVQTRLVLVPTVVTGAKGAQVEDLQASDFVVLDNGRPQRASVDTIATGVAPIALVVAIQTSGISAAALTSVRQVGSMIQPLITGERGCAGVIVFDERVRWLTECTKDPDAVTQAFARLQTGEDKSARMLDAVHEAVAKLSARPNVRRVLLLISETRDRGSETSLETALMAAQAADVVVYAATYSAFRTAFLVKPGDTGKGGVHQPPPTVPRSPEQSPSPANIPVPPPSQRVDILGGFGELIRLGQVKTTEAMAVGTGGAEFPFTRRAALEKAVMKLGDELHGQYVIGFVPEDRTPGFHKLEVKVRRAGDYRVRARPGYWAVAE